jgi:hypothetical protein
MPVNQTQARAQLEACFQAEAEVEKAAATLAAGQNTVTQLQQAHANAQKGHSDAVQKLTAMRTPTA